jgi:hypothetical protein
MMIREVLGFPWFEAIVAASVAGRLGRIRRQD